MTGFVLAQGTHQTGCEIADCVMKLIANGLSVAKVAPTEMAGEARPNKPALLNRQRM